MSLFLFQEDTACTSLECYRHMYTLCLLNPSPRDGSPIPFFLGQAGCRALLPGWLCSSQKRVASSQILSRRPHTNKHTLVVWICDLRHKQINKQQTSIRCNHTHNTPWVHLKCTHIKQRQYKPDWRCTIHTLTQNVTTMPSTDNTTAHHKQTTTHPTPQTTINQRTKTSTYFKST